MIISQHTGQPVKVMFAMVGKGKAVHYSPSNDETLCGKAIRAYVSADESADAPLCKVCARIERVKSDEYDAWEAAQVTAATREGMEIQGEYVEAPDAHGHMAEQLAWMTQEGVCMGLCAVGTGCEHCDEQYGTGDAQTAAESVSPAEINKDREVYAEWERDLLAGADFLPVVPSPVLCQDCLTNEATIFDLDAPSCDECERKYAAMNEPKKVATVNVVQARAGSNGMNHYHAPGCRDIARESKRHGARKDMGIYEFPFSSVAAIIEHEYSDCNNGDWADMIAHANDTFDGLVIMPCLRETLPLGMTPDGYMITQTPSGWGWKNAPLEKELCTRCEVHGDISMPGKEIDGEWVCGFCLANPELLTSTQKNESADTVATLVTREYHLRVLVDENTGATVDLGWVTLTVPSAFADSSDHVAAVYGAVHGEGDPRGGWGSIITVVESADL